MSVLINNNSPHLLKIFNSYFSTPYNIGWNTSLSKLPGIGHIAHGHDHAPGPAPMVDPEPVPSPPSPPDRPSPPSLPDRPSPPTPAPAPAKKPRVQKPSYDDAIIRITKKLKC